MTTKVVECLLDRSRLNQRKVTEKIITISQWILKVKLGLNESLQDLKIVTATHQTFLNCNWQL